MRDSISLVSSISEARNSIFGNGKSANVAISFLERLTEFYSSTPSKKLSTSEVAREISSSRGELQYLLQRPSVDFQKPLLENFLESVSKKNRHVVYFLLTVDGIGKHGLQNASTIPNTFGTIAMMFEDDGNIFPLHLFPTSGKNFSERVNQTYEKFSTLKVPSHHRSIVMNTADEIQAKRMISDLPSSLCCKIISTGQEGLEFSQEELQLKLRELRKIRTGQVQFMIQGKNSITSIQVASNGLHTFDPKFVDYLPVLNSIVMPRSIQRNNFLSSHFEFYRTPNASIKDCVSQLSRLAIFISIAKIEATIKEYK